MEKENNFFKGAMVFPAYIIGSAFVIATIIGAYTFYAVKSFDNTLSVTGSAKQRVIADSAKWTFSISRLVNQWGIQTGYSQLAGDLVATKAFLSAKNIKDSEIEISPVLTEEQYKYSPQGDQGPKEYNLRQQITVRSSDVAKIGDLAKSVSELSAKGVFTQGYYPEYFYTKLADLRVSLLSGAVKDAKARATELAKNTGRKVGALKSASSGVVQVLQPDSVEVSDYGQYDTQTVEKDVMVTVRAVFLVR